MRNNNNVNSNFPVLLLLGVLLLTVGISGIMVFINRSDPAMSTASTVASTTGTTDPTADASTEEASDAASMEASVSPLPERGESSPELDAARSSTSTAVIGQLPRSLPVEGEEPLSAEGSESAAEQVTLIDRESLLEQRNREQRGIGHLTGVSELPPDSGVTYEQIWAQFAQGGEAMRFDAAYNAVETESNQIVDNIYVEMTRMRAGNGSEEVLLEFLSDLESIDVTSFAQSEKLLVRRSAYYLDWQNVCVAQYAEDFARGYEEGDADAMRIALERTSEVYRQMAYETDYRFQVVNTR